MKKTKYSMTNGIYYTYIYYDPTRNNEPFYVGKGKGNRAFSTYRNKAVKGRIEKIQKAGHAYRIGIYAGMSEELALLTEEFFIWKYGRVNSGTGCLLNLTSGGERGTHGPDTIKKISDAKLGKVCSEETRRKISASRLGQLRGPLTEEHKRKISSGNKGKIRSDDTKRRISSTLKGNTPWNKGKRLK